MDERTDRRKDGEAEREKDVSTEMALEETHVLL